MKKRLLSALLALALVFVLLPTTALAGETTGSDYDISINGTNYVFSDSETCYFKSSFTSTEPSSPYLKLTKNSNTITVTVSGYVTVSDINVHNNFSTQDKINLIITGNKGSTLNIECKDTYGAALEIYQSGDITIKGGITVNANFSADNTDKYTDCYGIRASKNLIITGKGTTVNAVNADDAAAVKVDGNITVSDGAQLKATNKYSKKVTNYTGNAYAIECGGQLSISGDKTQVTADTSNGKKAISGTVNNGDKLTFKAANYKGSQIFLQRPMDEALGYKYVEITQAPTDPYVLINGQYAIIGQETPIPGGTGTYLYKKTTYNGSFLTLKGVDITGTSSGPAQAIRFGKNGYYTIKLEGENKISGFSSGIVAPNDSGVNDVTVVLSGSGSLDISANQYAIDMQVGKLKFENTGKIMLTTGYVFTSPLNALRVKPGSITIDNTKYDIVGARQEKDYPTETISDSIAFTPDLLNGYTVGETTTLFKTITITPAAAKDSTIRYNGTTLKQGEIIKGEISGTATVATKGNTITLNNFKGTQALSFEATLADSTLVLEGTNTLSSIVTTQKGLTISGSGSGSLTAGSIRVPNNTTTSNSPNLTIDGATVIAGTNTSTTRAIEVKGDLTVKNNATLTATSKSDSVPTVQVGGNATFTGRTVTITNYSTTQGSYGVDSNAASSALHVNGAVTISGGTVTAEAKAGGNAIRAVGNITVSNDATVTATNNSQHFSAITAGQASGGVVNNLSKLIVSGETTKITATNSYANSSTGAIHAKIKNANEGHYLQVGTGTDTKAIAPNAEDNNTGRGSITITRGDAYTTPQVAANYTIAGQTMYVGKYYKTDVNGNITDGTAQDYNIFCDSANDFTLNNATISSTGTGGSTGVIKTNLNYSSAPFHIKLIGTNSINNAGHHAILGEGAYSTIFIENAENASNASLTISGNYLPVYSYGNVTINAEVVIINTNGNLISTNKDGHANGAFDLGSGYKCYASTSVSGSPLETYDAAKSSTYKYLCVTTKTLETGGGSTHQHVFSTSWESNADYHWHKCTVQGCTEVSDKEAHVYTNTWWKNSNGNHGRTCDKCRHEGEIHEFRKYYDFVDATYHVERCSYPNCTYVGNNETHSYDSFGTCKCGYNPNGLPAPPSLQGVAPTSENGTDGKILNSNIGMEYAQNLNGPWTKWNEHSNITGLSAGTYYVRYTKTDERFPDNQVATVEVPAYTPGGDPTPDIPAAPTGLVGVAPTSENGNGKITGTTAQMEYASSLEGDWTTCANDSTDVPAGKYYVRMKKTDNTPAGEVVEVTVPAYSGTGEITPDPTPDNPGTIVIIRPAEEEKPAQQPNPSTGANDLVGLAVAAAVAAALGSAALLRKHD